MLKVLVVIALAFSFAVCTHGEANPPTSNPTQATNPAPAIAALASPEKPTTENGTHSTEDGKTKDEPKTVRIIFPAKDKYDYWAFAINVVLAGVGLIGIGVGLGSLCILRKQTNHIITSERAWMVAEPGNAVIPPEIEGATGVRGVMFSVRFVNKGKTPAFLLEVGHCGKVLPHSEQLPAIQPSYKDEEISKWDGKGLPVLTETGVAKDHLITWANDPVKITRGLDVLWVYGYIKYGDAFGNQRETWYCYRWVHEIERYQVSGFIARGPESYNRAT